MMHRYTHGRADVINKHDSANVSHGRFYLTDTQAPDGRDNRREVANDAGVAVRASRPAGGGFSPQQLCWNGAYWAQLAPGLF